MITTGTDGTNNNSPVHTISITEARQMIGEVTFCDFLLATCVTNESISNNNDHVFTKVNQEKPFVFYEIL